MKIDEGTRGYLSKIGAKGGRSRSAAKLAAVRANVRAATDARRKYPPCRKYKNRSHRFSPTTGKCYGCRFKRPI